MNDEDRLTYALQAEGPDEFPEGYYRHLARLHLNPTDPGPDTPSPVAGPVAASTSGSTSATPTENRESA